MLPAPAPMDLRGLNPSQREAVLHTEGPLLVLAGAGSGKTRVITHRIAHLLEKGVGPQHVVAVSFTNKAAAEMRERLARMIGAATADKVVLSTFHSLGVRMLREDPAGFGLDGNRFSILDQGDSLGLLRGLLQEHGLQDRASDRRFDVMAVAQRISLWKNDFADVKALRKKKWDSEYDAAAATIFGAYAERLTALGAVDFDDLVCRVASRLRDDGAVRERWQRKFRYLMIDEYQDTNHSQLEMIRQLAGKRANLCVVGDDDQAIYGWRGADIANILGFERHFPGARVVKLEENYRSRPEILACANAVIALNRYRHAKTLRATKPPGETVDQVITTDPVGEARWVSRRIRELVKERRIPASEIAVLYRSSLQARGVEQELEEHGIPSRVLGGQAYYDKKEVKDAMAYLKLLVAPGDELAVRRALETPPRGIGPKALEVLRKAGEERGKGLAAAILHAPTLEGLPRAAVGPLSELARHLEAARARARSAGVAAGLSELLEGVGLRAYVDRTAGSAEAARIRWQDVEWLVASVDRFEGRARARNERPRWHEYLGSAALDSSGESNEESAREASAASTGEVTLATLHSAKGLEWDYVFLLGCEEGRLPHRRVDSPRASDAIAGDVEEERRLFYVGITRARERLWLLRSQARTDHGRTVPTPPSRFLADLPATVRTWDVAKEEELSGSAVDAMAEAFLSRLRERA